MLTDDALESFEKAGPGHGKLIFTRYVRNRCAISGTSSGRPPMNNPRAGTCTPRPMIGVREARRMQHCVQADLVAERVFQENIAPYLNTISECVDVLAGFLSDRGRIRMGALDRIRREVGNSFLKSVGEEFGLASKDPA